MTQMIFFQPIMGIYVILNTYSRLPEKIYTK